MAGKSKESGNAHSPANQLAGWARQGIDSFVAGQKILLDLTAQQNALVIGMLREGTGASPYCGQERRSPQSLTRVFRTSALLGKILLDLATDRGRVGGESSEGSSTASHGLHVPWQSLLRDRLVTFSTLRSACWKPLAEQTHKAAESYRRRQRIVGGARREAWCRTGAAGHQDNLVETEKEVPSTWPSMK